MECRTIPFSFENRRHNETISETLFKFYVAGDDGKPYVATRGSFTSDQAIKATEMLQWYDISKLDRNQNLIFEIIYNENRIVLDYRGFEGLVQLAVFDNEGNELPNISTAGFEIPSEYNFCDKTADEIMVLDFENKEGVIAVYENGYRVKLKFPTYCRLHRIITNITARDIWRVLSEGKDFEKEILENVPDEFYDWVKATEVKLRDECLYYKLTTQKYYGLLKTIDDNRKEFAAKLKAANLGKEYTGLVWYQYDEKFEQMDKYIWSLVYPKHEKPFMSK